MKKNRIRCKICGSRRYAEKMIDGICCGNSGTTVDNVQELKSSNLEMRVDQHLKETKIFIENFKKKYGLI